MSKNLKRLAAILLAALMIVGLLPTFAAASVQEEPARNPLSAPTTASSADAAVPNGMQVHTPYGLKLGTGKQATRGETRDLPKSFNSVNEGWITSVKNQMQYGNYGTC